MNGMLNPIIFYSASALLIVAALLTFKFKNIFYSLISAIAMFFVAGMIFYILGSEYNAVIQIAIYGVAVPIILALAIMFTNPRMIEEDKSDSKNKYLLIFFAGIFILAVVYLIMTSSVLSPESFSFSENVNANPRGVLLSFGQGLYVNYVWAFELVSIILTMVVAGIAILDRNKEVK